MLHFTIKMPFLEQINEDEEADVLVTTLTSMTLDRRPYRGDPTTTDATYKGEPTTTKRRDSASSSQDEGSNKTRTGRISCKVSAGRERKGNMGNRVEGVEIDECNHVLHVTLDTYNSDI